VTFTVFKERYILASIQSFLMVHLHITGWFVINVSFMPGNVVGMSAYLVYKFLVV